DGIRDGHVTGVQTCALPISTVCRLPAARLDSIHVPRWVAGLAVGLRLRQAVPGWRAAMGIVPARRVHPNNIPGRLEGKPRISLCRPVPGRAAAIRGPGPTARACRARRGRLLPAAARSVRQAVPGLTPTVCRPSTLAGSDRRNTAGLVE